MSGRYNYFNRVLNPNWGAFDFSLSAPSEIHLGSIEWARDEPDEPLTATSPMVIRLVQLMLQEALQWNATVLRIQPQEDRAQVHHQIYGQFVKRESMPLAAYEGVLERVKHCQATGEDLGASLSVQVKPALFDTPFGQVVWLKIERQ